MTTPNDILSRFNERAYARRMADALVPRYLDLLELAWNEQADRFPGLGAWDVKNPAVTRAVKRLTGERIKAMAQTTKDDLRRLLEGIFDAEQVPGTDEIARMIREAGIEQARFRAERLARTETAIAYNMGTITAYREAGIEKVEVLDGDEDEDCASVDGTIQTLEWAEENPTAHPNCVRAFTAVVE